MQVPLIYFVKMGFVKQGFRFADIVIQISANLSKILSPRCPNLPRTTNCAFSTRFKEILLLSVDAISKTGKIF